MRIHGKSHRSSICYHNMYHLTIRIYKIFPQLRLSFIIITRINVIINYIPPLLSNDLLFPNTRCKRFCSTRNLQTSYVKISDGKPLSCWRLHASDHTAYDLWFSGTHLLVHFLLRWRTLCQFNAVWSTFPFWFNGTSMSPLQRRTTLSCYCSSWTCKWSVDTDGDALLFLGRTSPLHYCSGNDCSELHIS